MSTTPKAPLPEAIQQMRCGRHRLEKRGTDFHCLDCSFTRRPGQLHYDTIARWYDARGGDEA